MASGCNERVGLKARQGGRRLQWHGVVLSMGSLSVEFVSWRSGCVADRDVAVRTSAFRRVAGCCEIEGRNS